MKRLDFVLPQLMEVVYVTPFHANQMLLLLFLKRSSKLFMRT